MPPANAPRGAVTAIIALRAELTTKHACTAPLRCDSSREPKPTPESGPGSINDVVGVARELAEAVRGT